MALKLKSPQTKSNPPSYCRKTQICYHRPNRQTANGNNETIRVQGNIPREDKFRLRQIRPYGCFGEYLKRIRAKKNAGTAKQVLTLHSALLRNAPPSRW